MKLLFSNQIKMGLGKMLLLLLNVSRKLIQNHYVIYSLLLIENKGFINFVFLEGWLEMKDF